MAGKVFRIRNTVRGWAAIVLVALQVASPSIPMAQIGSSEKATATAKSGTSGFVNAVSGIVYIRRGDAPETIARAGDLFDAGTTFRTAGNSTAVLLFADGQNVALSANSTLKIEDFHYDPRDAKAGRASLGLEIGMMRVVTGAIHTGNPDALLISGGKAFVDILSPDVTAFVIEVDPKSLTVGSAAVTLGEISILTPQGWSVRIGSDQFVRWPQATSPLLPLPLAAAPAAIQAAAYDAAAKVVGSSSSIDVQAAALAATLSSLPATGAGAPEPIVQAQATQTTTPVVVPAGTPGGGGGRGCVGSPC